MRHLRQKLRKLAIFLRVLSRWRNIPPRRKMVLLDIGAMNGLQGRWEALRKAGALTPILVEPNPEEAQRLREAMSIPVYQGQKTLEPIVALLRQAGFEMVALKTTGTFGGEGVRAYEYDAFFVNARGPGADNPYMHLWLENQRIEALGSWDNR